MHRAPASAPSALLMATATAALLVARVHSQSSAIESINPWLSACDLVQPGITDDLQGACSATTGTMPMPLIQGPGPPKRPADTCPPPCNHNHQFAANSQTSQKQQQHSKSSSSSKSLSSYASASSSSNSRSSASSSSSRHQQNKDDNSNTTNQCLYYLEESHKDEVCAGDKSADYRLQRIRDLRLRHCCEHAVVTALRPRDRHAVLAGGAQCRNHLDALLEIDALAARISCEFTEVLTRYDCGQTYSIVYHCDDCKEAYRRWVCSSLVPHLTADGGRVRPCRSVCQRVEQRCPYMLPGDRAPAHPTQYAGEPTFLCLDPNIPETGMQKERSSHGDDDCCYTYCGTPGRPPCVNCPRKASNTTWDTVQCVPPGPPKPPSGPTGCRGGLLTAPIPPTSVTSSAVGSWRIPPSRRRTSKTMLPSLCWGQNSGAKRIEAIGDVASSESVTVTVTVWYNNYLTKIFIAVAFTLSLQHLLMFGVDEVLTLILLIPSPMTSLLLMCVQRARTWMWIKTTNSYHWTTSQHTRSHSHTLDPHPLPEPTS